MLSELRKHSEKRCGSDGIAVLHLLFSLRKQNVLAAHVCDDPPGTDLSKTAGLRQSAAAYGGNVDPTGAVGTPDRRHGALPQLAACDLEIRQPSDIPADQIHRLVCILGVDTVWKIQSRYSAAFPLGGGFGYFRSGLPL